MKDNHTLEIIIGIGFLAFWREQLRRILFISRGFIFSQTDYDQRYCGEKTRDGRRKPAAPKRPQLRVVREKSLQEALAPTRASIFPGACAIFFDRSDKTAAGQAVEAVEEILYTSDLGPTTVQRLLRAGLSESFVFLGDCRFLQAPVPFERRDAWHLMANHQMTEPLIAAKSGSPQIWMVVGVNGVGKTTTIGKLAHTGQRTLRFARFGRGG